MWYNTNCNIKFYNCIFHNNIININNNTLYNVFYSNSKIIIVDHSLFIDNYNTNNTNSSFTFDNKRPTIQPTRIPANIPTSTPSKFPTIIPTNYPTNIMESTNDANNNSFKHGIISDILLPFTNNSNSFTIIMIKIIIIIII